MNVINVPYSMKILGGFKFCEFTNESQIAVSRKLNTCRLSGDENKTANINIYIWAKRKLLFPQNVHAIRYTIVIPTYTGIYRLIQLGY